MGSVESNMEGVQCNVFDGEYAHAAPELSLSDNVIGGRRCSGRSVNLHIYLPSFSSPRRVGRDYRAERLTLARIMQMSSSSSSLPCRQVASISLLPGKNEDLEGDFGEGEGALSHRWNRIGRKTLGLGYGLENILDGYERGFQKAQMIVGPRGTPERALYECIGE